MLPGSSSQLPSAIWAEEASVYSQRPFLVMPILISSYLSGSILSTKVPAETRLTSCSLDMPPNSSATHRGRASEFPRIQWLHSLLYLNRSPLKGAFNHNYNHHTIKMRRFPYTGGKMPRQNPKKLSRNAPPGRLRAGERGAPWGQCEKKSGNPAKKCLTQRGKRARMISPLLRDYSVRPFFGGRPANEGGSITVIYGGVNK